jgi:hypothetical protein
LFLHKQNDVLNAPFPICAQPSVKSVLGFPPLEIRLHFFLVITFGWPHKRSNFAAFAVFTYCFVLWGCGVAGMSAGRLW